MRLDIIWTSQFKRDYKLAMKRSLRMDTLDNIIRQLFEGQSLPKKTRDQLLTGNWIGYRKCPIQSDWLLIYRIENDLLVLTRARTGSHSDLFNQ